MPRPAHVRVGVAHLSARRVVRVAVLVVAVSVTPAGCTDGPRSGSQSACEQLNALLIAAYAGTLDGDVATQLESVLHAQDVTPDLAMAVGAMLELIRRDPAGVSPTEFQTFDDLVAAYEADCGQSGPSS